MMLIRQPTTLDELEQAVQSVALKRQIIRQGDGKLYLCGQCCVAMASGTSLDEAIIACGELGATTGQDLMNGLRLLGLNVKWCRMFATQRIPEHCIIRRRNSESSHWTYRYYDGLYDPAANHMLQWDARLFVHAPSLIELL
jgi:hypothetical protein